GGLHEKNITLSIDRELQRQNNQVRGYRAELTRTGDYLIPLRKRTEIARKKGADLFVSIHADAAPRRSAFGASVVGLVVGAIVQVVFGLQALVARQV
ncbi:N-acetylmuramoyl-L-alanine amidase, partial [Pseudomonas aeruginosa]